MEMTPTIRVAKYNALTQYDECDDSHPLSIVEQVYERIVVAELSIMNKGTPKTGYAEYNDDYIFDNLMSRKEVQWAHDNAFDKPHFSKQIRLETDETCFRVSMYLKPEHCTFWRLQFG
jgi:hypothetical protein